jgi:hypothetical protein
MKRRQESQHGGFGSNPLGQGDAVLDSFSSQFRPVRWYQDVGIHRPLLDHGLRFAARHYVLVELAEEKPSAA